MKKALLSFAALATLAVAAPSMAQPYYGGGYNNGYNGGYDRSYDRSYDRGGYDRDRRDGDYGNFQVRIDRVARQIDMGARSGRLDAREYRALRQDLRQIQ